MRARVVIGVGKGVLFREVSSVQECPHRERFHCIMYHTTITEVDQYCKKKLCFTCLRVVWVPGEIQECL